jgi:hypothetical protein
MRPCHWLLRTLKHEEDVAVATFGGPKDVDLFDSLHRKIPDGWVRVITFKFRFIVSRSAAEPVLPIARSVTCPVAGVFLWLRPATKGHNIG